MPSADYDAPDFDVRKVADKVRERLEAVGEWTDDDGVRLRMRDGQVERVIPLAEDVPDVRVEYAIHLHTPTESHVYADTYGSADDAAGTWAYHASDRLDHIVTLVERVVTTAPWESSVFPPESEGEIVTRSPTSAKETT